MLNALATAIYLTLLSSDAFCSAELDRLLVLHDSYGLPHPPKDAALVVFVSGQSFVSYEGLGFTKCIWQYAPTIGFSRDEKTALDDLGKPFDVLSIKIIKPDPSAIKDDVQLGALEDAIQYHGRGWKALARATFRKWAEFDSFITPDKHLRFHAWCHWIRRLHHDPDAPLATIAKRLKQIQLPGWEKEQKKLLTSLDLALKPRNSKPGSDEALIDALIEARGREPFESSSLTGFRLDPRYRALLRRSLDAAPALIAHLDDDRLVRCYSRRCGCGEDLRVRHIALDLLMQMNGGYIVQGWSSVLDDGLPKEWPEEFNRWYADVRKLSEEQHILSRILGENKGDEEFRPGLLWLLAEKYPNRLPEVFRKAIDTRKEHSYFAWKYAKAVAEARIPDDDKRKILEYAATQKQPVIRAAGICYLRKFNPKLAKEQLLLALAEIPADPNDGVAFAFVTAESGDPDEWKALSRAVRHPEFARQADRQINLICAILCAKAPEGRAYRLAFLAEYLADDLRAQAPADRHAQVETRHFAQIQLAALLKIEVDPYSMDGTAAMLWKKFREPVKEVLWP